MHYPFLLYAYLPLLCYGFNLDTRYAIIYESPLKSTESRSSYFGYSVILQAGENNNSKPWVQIGAPRGNSTVRSPRIYEPGVVFRCIIGNSCSELLLDDTDDRRTHYLEKAIIRDKKDTAWIGGSMTTNQDRGGFFVTCGHRWANQAESEYLYMNGICYSMEKYENIDRQAQRQIPLADDDRQLRHIPGLSVSVFDYGVGQAGMSVHIPVLYTKEYTEILIGAPGVLNWRGTPILYRRHTLSDDSGLSRQISPLSFEARIPDPYGIQNLRDFSLLGYAVTSGCFQYERDLLYVASAPRSDRHKGKVILFKYTKNQFRRDVIRITATKFGMQFGEYFGSSMAVADFNNDGLDDLAVGAPLFTNTKDEGRIHVFLGNSRTILEQALKDPHIRGNVSNARFGTAVSAIGDINQDGFQDIAVGAPYENNGGAVYIFHGSASGLNPNPSQRIVASSISPDLQGFGISISNGADIDENFYNDIAVGSFLSGHTVVLRSRPIVRIDTMNSNSRMKLSKETTHFNTTVCFRYEGKYIPERIEIEVVVEPDPRHRRALLDVNGTLSRIHSYPLSLIRSDTSCRTLHLQLQKENQQFLNPIAIEVEPFIKRRDDGLRDTSIWIREKEETNEEIADLEAFCKSCPVMDTTYMAARTFSIPFSIGCGDDEICNSDLKVSAAFEGLSQIKGDKNVLIIGSRRSMELRIQLSNSGEPAYLATVLVTIPSPIYWDSIPGQCFEIRGNESSTASCGLGNPLEQNMNRPLILLVDVSPITEEIPDITVLVQATTDSNETREEDNEVVLPLKFKNVADLAIFGQAVRQQYHFDTKSEDIELPNISFAHQYVVQKFNVSPIKWAAMEITIPTHFISKDGVVYFVNLYETKVILDGQAKACETDGKLVSSKEEGFDTDAGNGKLSRKKRDVNNLPANRTFLASCTQNSKIMCSKVICYAGPFIRTQSTARILVQMVMNTKLIKPLMGTRDVVKLITSGKVTILEPSNVLTSDIYERQNEMDVYTLFLGSIQDAVVETWIIALSIVGGLLVFFVLILILFKCGFFERTKKKELEELKKEDEVGRTQGIAQEISQKEEDDDDEFTYENFAESRDETEVKSQGKN